VNQLARRAPKELHAYIDATAAVRGAQQKGAAVREAMQSQREALGRLLKAEPSMDVPLVQASAMSEPEALREGRLLHEIEASGFDALLAAGIAPAPPSTHAAKARPPEPPKPSAAELRKQRELAEAREKAGKLSAKADDLSAKAAELSAKAAELEKQAHKARAEADEAAARVRALSQEEVR
jgi:hypothetical protein